MYSLPKVAVDKSGNQLGGLMDDFTTLLSTAGSTALKLYQNQETLKATKAVAQLTTPMPQYVGVPGQQPGYPPGYQPGYPPGVMPQSSGMSNVLLMGGLAVGVLVLVIAMKKQS